MVPFVLRSHVAAAAPAQASVTESDYATVFVVLVFHSVSLFLAVFHA
jgi:hypothetical protein